MRILRGVAHSVNRRTGGRTVFFVIFGGTCGRRHCHPTSLTRSGERASQSIWVRFSLLCRRMSICSCTKATGTSSIFINTIEALPRATSLLRACTSSTATGVADIRRRGGERLCLSSPSNEEPIEGGETRDDDKCTKNTESCFEAGRNVGGV